jgi:hypothetical protein
MRLKIIEDSLGWEVFNYLFLENLRIGLVPNSLPLKHSDKCGMTMLLVIVIKELSFLIGSHCTIHIQIHLIGMQQ